MSLWSLVVAAAVLQCISLAHSYCAPYNGHVCKSYSPGLVWYNQSGGHENERIAAALWVELISRLDEPCRSRAERLLCAYAFPKCIQKKDHGDFELPLCYEDCIAVKMQFCYNDWMFLEERKRFGLFLQSRGHFSLPECERLPRRTESGVQPSCGSVGLTDMDEAEVTTDCVQGNGRYYQGTVNITEHGLACQRWDSQQPHQHNRPPLVFAEIQNSTNYCRNAGGEQRSPWCYTMDPTKRWQYCSIPLCANSSDIIDKNDGPSVVTKNYFTPTFVLILSVACLGGILVFAALSFLCHYIVKNHYAKGPN